MQCNKLYDFVHLHKPKFALQTKEYIELLGFYFNIRYDYYYSISTSAAVSGNAASIDCLNSVHLVNRALGSCSATAGSPFEHIVINDQTAMLLPKHASDLSSTASQTPLELYKHCKPIYILR